VCSLPKEYLKVQFHEIVCQLRPLTYSLDLNNAPCISFKLGKSLFKLIRHFKQGASRCKMAAKLRAPMPRFATIRITVWQSALNRTVDCQPPLSGLKRSLRAVQAFHSQIRTSDYSNPRYGNFLCGNPPENTAICQYSVTNLSAEFSNRVESIPRHFTSKGPLFELSYIFEERLYKFKTNTRSII
jgi:hypothetical protein